MLRRLRPHLTYANVTATLALFIALGGGAYAAVTITGRDVKDGSLTGRDIKRNSIGGKRVKESALGTVPRAATLNGVTAARLLVRCPRATFPAAGTCIETDTRPPASYGSAVLACADAGGQRTPNRRLPTHGELSAAYARVDPAPGGELTGHVYPRADGNQDVLIVTSKGGASAAITNDGGNPRAFRCAADPLN